MIKKNNIFFSIALMASTTTFALPLDGLMARLGEASSPYVANSLERDPFGTFVSKGNDLSPAVRHQEEVLEEEDNPSSMSFEEFKAQDRQKQETEKNIGFDADAFAGSSGIRV